MLTPTIHQGFLPEPRVLADILWNSSVGAYDIPYVTPQNESSTYRVYSSELAHFPAQIHRAEARHRFERTIGSLLGYVVEWL